MPAAIQTPGERRASAVSPVYCIEQTAKDVNMTETMQQFILIIDDSITIRKILEVTTRRAGYASIGFPDSMEALRWLSASAERIPALMFVDLSLPKLNGFKVIQRLKDCRRLSQTPIVIISSRDGVLDRLKGRLAGADDYLTKPFTTRQISAVMQARLAQPTGGAG
ncbi:MAG: response regulator transcription factor [Ktedonobacteraceae bacterium]